MCNTIKKNVYEVKLGRCVKECYLKRRIRIVFSSSFGGEKGNKY